MTRSKIRDRTRSRLCYERCRKGSAKGKECRQCNDPHNVMDFNEDQESRAFRAFREKAAADTCSICFEDKPNIVTLCCGKAVHITCMTKWMNEKESCHHCRMNMSPSPARPVRPVRPIAASYRRPMYYSDGISIIHNDEMTLNLSTSIDSSYDIDNNRTNINETSNYHINNVDLTHNVIECSSYDGSIDDGSSTRRWTGRNQRISPTPYDFPTNTILPQHVSSSKKWCFLPFEENLRRFLAKITNIFVTSGREDSAGSVYVEDSHRDGSTQTPYTYPMHIFQYCDSFERNSLHGRYERPPLNILSTTNSHILTSIQSTVPLASSMVISIGEESSSNSSLTSMQEGDERPPFNTRSMQNPHHRLSLTRGTVPRWIEIGEESIRNSSMSSTHHFLNNAKEIYPIPLNIQPRSISTRSRSEYNTQTSGESPSQRRPIGSRYDNTTYNRTYWALKERYEERYPIPFSDIQSRPRPELRSDPPLPPSYNIRGRH